MQAGMPNLAQRYEDGKGSKFGFRHYTIFV